MKFLIVFNRNKNLDDESLKEKMVHKTLEYVGVRTRIDV